MFDLFQKLLLFGLVPFLIWHFYRSKKYYPIYFFVAILLGIMAEAVPGPNLANIFEGSWLQIILFLGFMFLFAVAPVVHKQYFGDGIKYGFLIPWVLTLTALVIFVGINSYVKFSGRTFDATLTFETYALLAFVLLSIQSAIILRKEIRSEYF